MLQRACNIFPGLMNHARPQSDENSLKLHAPDAVLTPCVTGYIELCVTGFPTQLQDTSTPSYLTLQPPSPPRLEVPGPGD